MMRHTVWHAASSRDHVQVTVAFVVAHEGDLRTIGRKTRNHFNTIRRREGQSNATFDGYTPEVVRIGEDDLFIGDVRIPEHRGTTVLDGWHGG